jgi:hypothetical protein
MRGDIKSKFSHIIFYYYTVSCKLIFQNKKIGCYFLILKIQIEEKCKNILLQKNTT